MNEEQSGSTKLRRSRLQDCDLAEEEVGEGDKHGHAILWMWTVGKVQVDLYRAKVTVYHVPGASQYSESMVNFYIRPE